jgi:hypothetical protein
MADDQQGGRRSAEELAYHMREGLRNVREIARRALEMGVLAVATVGSVLSVPSQYPVRTGMDIVLPSQL